MHIQLIEEFVELAETLRFTTAAKNMFISQSTLSKHVLSLEKELGSRLFVRDAQSVQLSSEGEIFYTHAKTIVKEYRAAADQLRLHQENINSVLSLGYVIGLGKNAIAKSRLAFLKENPGTSLQLYTMEPDRVCRSLLKDEIDIGIMPLLPNYATDELEVRTLFTDVFGIGVGLGHRLSKKDFVSIEDIVNENLVMPDQEECPLMRRWHEHILLNAGYTAGGCAQFSDLDSLELLLASGEYVGLVSGHLQNHFGDSIKFIPLRGSESSLPVVVAWKRSSPKTVIANMVGCILNTCTGEAESRKG